MKLIYLCLSSFKIKNFFYIQASMEELTDNFAFAYSIALEKIFNEFQHDEDSSNDWSAVGRRKVYEFNNITMIYQPKNPSEGWIEEGAIIFTLSKEAKVKGLKFNEKSLEKFKPVIDIVNMKLYESFMNFTKSREHMWFETIETTTFLNVQDFVNQLCGITKPLTFEKGVLKLSFKIKWFYCEYNVWGWNPVELIDYRMSLYSQASYEESWIAKETSKAKETYEDEETVIRIIEMRKNNNYLLKKIDYYVDDEEERIKYLLERGRLFIPKILDLKSKDFEIKKSKSINVSKNLSGTKRKRNEIE